MNLNITPDLTIQYYGQPYASRGEYHSFKYVVDPLSKNKETALYRYSDAQIQFSGNTYSVDEDLDGVTDYSFNNPDFDFVQFRSNLVVRWEYIPGSEIYLVWTQGNTVYDYPGQRSILDTLTENLFGDNTRNTFLLKMTYRFLNK